MIIIAGENRLFFHVIIHVLFEIRQKHKKNSEMLKNSRTPNPAC